MRSLFLAVMLIASMLFASVAIAAPKHTPAKHGQQDASKTVDQPVEEAPPPEPVDTSWKGQLGAMVVAMGGATLAGVLHVHPAYIAVAVIAVVTLILLGLLWIVVRIVINMSQRGPRTYAGDFSNSIDGTRQEPRVAPSIKPNIKPVTARAAQQIAKSKAAARDHADFDVAKFLRSANASFLRLQKSWDRGDTEDLKQFVTREIYAELKSQIKARGATESRTGVDSLDAELLKLESGDGKYVATVKFSGMIHEEDGLPAKFMEVWSLTRRIESDNWRLAGIQQFA